MSSLRQSFEAEGIEVIGADEHIIEPDCVVDEEMLDNMQLDDGVGAVVIGLDTSFTHQKLLLACQYILQNGVPLIATNGDRGTLIKGKIYPGAGSSLAAVLRACNLKKGARHDSCSKDEPGTFDLIGKPNPFAIDLIKKEHGLSADSRSLMIGDNPNTDIVFGKAAGIDQCLVLSGVVRSVEDFEENWLPENPTEYDPTYIMDLVGTFARANTLNVNDTE